MELCLAGDSVPAHQALSVDVDHENDVAEPRPGAELGQVGDPAAVRRRGGEIAVQQVRSPTAVLGKNSGPDASTTADPIHAELVHQPVHGAMGDRESPGGADRYGHLPATVVPF